MTASPSVYVFSRPQSPRTEFSGAREVVSDTDELREPDTGRKWIDVKRDIYLNHLACEAVLLIEQDRMEVRVEAKTDKGWTLEKLGPADDLHLPGFGLTCAVTDLYEGTPLLPRPSRQTTV